MPQYTYRAEWSPDYHEYVAVCLEYPFRFSRAPTPHEAIESLEREVAERVEEMVAAGTTPPESLTDRRYSGEFHVRTSPSLHSRLAVEANEQGVSLNQWVVQKLADRKSTPSLDDLF
ncbi:type II toxin-antitoxin system HicB family antitoxin [Mycolicibacterium moriokaense]|uniref:HicB-like protein involved in pilus formation n=1 Tax=Mycolicibacterium moriokaense TaxID=39691 RepID=A0A318HPM1_9MYCO|nr:type II toxin-antitoxin system HicB family antitoxin [Mycolicibacterium moriokaense]PXX08874.1 HicB-like protein involved in pilus formation [Mycolicibacterium moriokaense]